MKLLVQTASLVAGALVASLILRLLGNIGLAEILVIGLPILLVTFWLVFSALKKRLL